MTFSRGGKERALILEYDGVEYHTKNPDIVTKHNFSQEYLDYDISRQIELESYGYRATQSEVVKIHYRFCKWSWKGVNSCGR